MNLSFSGSFKINARPVIQQYIDSQIEECRALRMDCDSKATAVRAEDYALNRANQVERTIRPHLTTINDPDFPFDIVYTPTHDLHGNVLFDDVTYDDEISITYQPAKGSKRSVEVPQRNIFKIPWGIFREDTHELETLPDYFARLISYLCRQIPSLPQATPLDRFDSPLT